MLKRVRFVVPMLIATTLATACYAFAQEGDEFSGCNIYGVSTGMWDDGGPLLSGKCEGQFVNLNPFDVAILFGMKATPNDAVKAADLALSDRAKNDLLVSA